MPEIASALPDHHLPRPSVLWQNLVDAVQRVLRNFESAARGSDVIAYDVLSTSTLAYTGGRSIPDEGWFSLALHLHPEARPMTGTAAHHSTHLYQPQQRPLYV